MSQFAINIMFVGGSFLIYIAIAIWAKAGSTKDFYVAGGGVHPITNGMAIGADWMSAASRKFGKFTVPEFIGDRFYSKNARLVAVICLIVASVTYVIGQMAGAGVAFSRFLEVDSTLGLIIAAVVVFIYAVLGGMKGITYTQVAQYCVLIVAYTIPAVFISMQLTGNPIPALGLFSTHTDSGIPLLTKLNQIITELGFNEYTADVDNKLNMVLFTLSLMIGTAGLPHVIIRFFTVPKVADARWSAGWALVFIALLYLTAPAVASMARLNLMTTIYPDGTASAPIQYDERPNWVKEWEITGLIKFTDKNEDGRIQLYNDSPAFEPQAEARGWKGNELVVNRDILVLANPEIANLPSWVIGLIAAGGLAAALSTAAGLLLAISSAVSHDLIKGSINPGISEKGELLAARISMSVAIVVATWLGANPPGFAAQVVALAFGIAAASLFPALMMGIFSKRVNNVGAISGMLSGLIFTLVYIFMYKGWLFIPGTNNLPDTPDGWIMGISPLSIGAVGAIINFAVAFVVSNATEEPPVEIQELVESVRYPRGATGAQDH